MHEMGIALRIIEISTAAIPREAGAVRVEAVNLRVGKLTAVVPESLRFCFGVASQDTPLAGANLHIEETPVVVRCQDCDSESTIDEARFVCDQCGSGRLDVVSGRELTVTSIELSDPEGGPPAER